MQPYAIECDDCGARRLGRAREGTVVPVSATCGDCGSEAFAVLARQRAD